MKVIDKREDDDFPMRQVVKSITLSLFAAISKTSGYPLDSDSLHRKRTREFEASDAVRRIVSRPIVGLIK